MFKISNLFRELTMEHIKGYSNLSDKQKNIFDTTYKRHLSSMSINKRMKFTENRIKEIKIGEEITIIKVYFDHGECFIYFRNYRWMKVP